MIRLAVRVQRAQAELVLAELLELAPAGVEESQVGEDTIEYAVYGAPGELPSLPDLQAAAGEALVEISTSETADDWQERWKQFHRPVLIPAPEQRQGLAAVRPVPALRIRPPWEEPGAASAAAVEEIVIDPGQAFGTGAHASTSLCLELLLDLAVAEPARGPLLDVGTGSGVLAIAAARLGFGPVLGLDHERESVEAARANALVNDVQIGVERFDLRTEALPWRDGDGTDGDGPPAAQLVILANLLRPLLLELAGTIQDAPAHLIAGGLLREQADEVVSAFGGRLGMQERRRIADGEWCAVWLTGACSG